MQTILRLRLPLVRRVANSSDTPWYRIEMLAINSELKIRRVPLLFPYSADPSGSKARLVEDWMLRWRI